MKNRKPRSNRLYDVLLVVIRYADGGAKNCTSPMVARVLDLKPSTYVLGLLSELVADESLTKRYLRDSFGNAVYSYHPTSHGRSRQQKSADIGVLFLTKTSYIQKHIEEL